MAPEGNVTLVLPVLDAAVGTLSASPWPALLDTPLSITLVDLDVYQSTSQSASNVRTQTLKIRGPSMNFDLLRNGVEGLVTLVDDGTESGRFTGKLLPLLPGQAELSRQQWQSGSVKNAIDDLVSVNFDDWLLVEYDDLIPLQTVKYTIKVAMPGMLETSALRVGGEMTITVIDSDEDRSHDRIDTFFCYASVLTASVKVPMLETSPHSGVFTGLLSINPSSFADPFISNFTYLAGVAPGQTVNVTYDEREPSKRHTRTRRVDSSTIGVLSTNAVRGNINKRDLIAITVVDADLNLSPLLVDSTQVVVSLYASAAGSHNQLPEAVTLYEIDLNTTVFTGTLQTHSGARNGGNSNGAMDVFDGDVLLLRYRDAAPATTREAKIKVSTEAILTLSPSLLDAGKEITVQVNDFDLNTNATRVDMGTASVRSSNGNVQTILLRETALDSSVFTGILPTSTNYSAPAGTLAGAVPDSVITATYVDQLVDTETRTQSFSSVARVATLGSLVLLPVLITQHLPLTITVTDKDQNQNSSIIETLGCKLVSICSAESKSWDGTPLCRWLLPSQKYLLNSTNVQILTACAAVSIRQTSLSLTYKT